MTIVLDVSAAIQILLKKEKKLAFEEMCRKAYWVIAPQLYVSEIVNTFWKYYQRNILTPEECKEYVQDGIELIDDFFPEKDMWKEVLSESINNHHSAYDLFYAVLARRNASILVSNDKELLEIGKTMGIETFG